MVDIGDVTIRLRSGGAGPPLLLLHGHPQTHVMWHKIAPDLARDFTVVAPDLRGYGGSSKPAPAPGHETYSKRAMAKDQIAVMRTLGFTRFFVAGHDRGARCAYRMALDHPQQVEKLAVLDIIPTGEALRRTDMRFALEYWHWFFMAQPYDLPERLIGADPEWYFNNRGKGQLPFDAEARADYLAAYLDPQTRHAMCEDYRAGVTVDFELDEADRSAGRRLHCPLLALWAGRGNLGSWYDVLAVWREWANDVSGCAIDSGHYLAEEAPSETYAQLKRFFSS